MRVNGKVFVQFTDITKYESDHRVAVWINGQKEPCTIFKLSEHTGEKVSICKESKCGKLLYTLVDITTESVEPSMMSFLCFKVISSQITVPELVHSFDRDPRDKEEWHKSRYVNDVVVGTGYFNIVSCMVSASRGMMATREMFRAGNYGPKRGVCAFDCGWVIKDEDIMRTVANAGGWTKIGNMVTTALQEFKSNCDAVVKWTDAEQKCRLQHKHVNDRMRSSDHPKYFVSEREYVPTEFFFMPKCNTLFSEEAFISMMDAALFACNTNQEKMCAMLDSGNADAVRLVACRALGRLIGYFSTCLDYVPDYMIRRIKPTWFLSDDIKSRVVPGPDAHVELCEIYEEPLLTDNGDCEECGRLCLQAVSMLKVMAGRFKNECLRKLACLAEFYTFGAAIVTCRSHSTENGPEGMKNGGGEDDDDKPQDAHVVVLGIPKHFATKMLNAGIKNVTLLKSQVTLKESKYNELHTSQAIDSVKSSLPLILVEGTGIADPIQATARKYEASYTRLSTGEFGVYGNNSSKFDDTQMRILKKVDTVFTLGSGIFLAELRDYSELQNSRDAMPCNYLRAVRFYSWDMMTQMQDSPKCASFSFFGAESGAIGLKFSSLVTLSDDCCLIITGNEMGEDTLKHSLEMVDLYEAPVAVKCEDQSKSAQYNEALVMLENFITPYYHDPTSPFCVFAIKRRNMSRKIRQVMDQLRTYGLAVSCHHAYLTDKLRFLLLKIWFM